ncbi:MAG TPA: nitroreductase/quinone reductase family protein [Gaiellales bacterium]|nr:nitroreductase/quinone reductase family protein [Gaiellales bacterium]
MSQLKDALMGARSALHRFVFRVSSGRLLGTWGGHAVIRLTTRGRRSGRPRAVIVTAFPDGASRIVVVASDGGASQHPAWYLNLRRDPEVEVMRGGRSERMHARTATGEERARLWSSVTDAAPAYARYQAATDRLLPLVVLEPDGAGP